MKKVYLINQYDRYCPENNNGDFFQSAWSTRELADAELTRLRTYRDRDYPREHRYLVASNEWYIREFDLDKSSL